MNIGLWNIEGGKPVRLQRSSVGLERELEEWIEANPSVLQNGLSIVGRQMQVDSGRLDLLGLDPIGNWVVIEIKRGNVRRETVVQALDYAACVKEMTREELANKMQNYLSDHGQNLESLLSSHLDEDSIFEDRNLQIYVVGTGRDQDLERIARFLRGTGSQISVVNFEIFESSDGNLTVLRELTELDSREIRPVEGPSNPPSATSLGSNGEEIERLFALAEHNGIGEEFKRIFNAATSVGLYPRTYKWSIMYTPPTNKTRVLICAWVKPKSGMLDIYIGSQAFPEFYPISEKSVVGFLGQDGQDRFDLKAVNSFVKSLEALFLEINENL